MCSPIVGLTKVVSFFERGRLVLPTPPHNTTKARSIANSAAMSTPTLRFFTVCGHEATVKKCSTRDQWISRIVGPRVTNKSGVKTVYCDENEQAAKERIAKFLKISDRKSVV